MSKKKEPVVLRIVDYVDTEEETSEDEMGPSEQYKVHYLDLREIADRVYRRESIKEKFIEMYLSVEDLHDCSLTDKGFNLYTEDDQYMYVYTAIKKNEIE